MPEQPFAGADSDSVRIDESALAAMLRCVSITPFGSPVLPLEKMIVARSSALCRPGPRTQRSITHPGSNRTFRSDVISADFVMPATASSRWIRWIDSSKSSGILVRNFGK